MESFETFLSIDWIDEKEHISVTKHTATAQYPMHTHEFIEIEYIAGGKGVQRINGKDYPVSRGDLLFLNIGDHHTYTPEGSMDIVNCILTPQFVHHELVNSRNAMDILSLSTFQEFSTDVTGLVPIIQLTGKNLPDIENMIEAMIGEFRDKQPGYLTVLSGYVNILLARIFRILKGEDGGLGDVSRFAPQVLKYIEDNYDKKLTLKELAGISFFNPTYFSKLFKDCFGKSVTAYIGEKRFEAAVQLLRDSNETIEAIGFAVGYKDKKQLYKLFKDFAGTTPEKYRKLLNKG